MTEGSATRFGHSYRADNYSEVLSDALIDVVKELLKNPRFAKALARDGR